MSKPQRKPGFKGKTAQKKFTRTVKTGADQKNSRTREAYLEAVASGAAPPTNEDDDVVLAATSRAAAGAGCTTKAKLKSALLLSNKKLKQADQSKDKEERKRSHAETKLASATEAVHAARQEARESKKEQKRTAVELKRTEMALDMERARHDEDIRIAVDQTKAAERSFASNDKRSMQQLFDKQLSATEEHYEKRLQSLEVLYKKQLNKTQNQLHTTNLELQSTKSKIDSLKLQHKLTIKRMQTIHADRLESKKEQLRQADELVAGMQEMFEEMTKEVMDATTESEDAMKQMDRLKSKAVSAHAKYIEHKLLANELNDEVRDSSLTQQQLELENEEYKATIEYLYNCLDEQQTVNYACKMFCSHGGMSLACW